MMRLSLIPAMLVVIAVLSGCGEGPESSGMQSPGAGGPTQPMQPGFAGTVVETMDSGGYTYVLVDTGSEKIWAAGPVTEIKVGEALQLPPGMAMKDFKSGTLKRTFETIYFVNSLKAPAPGAAPGDPGQMIAKAHRQAGDAEAPKLDFAGLQKPEGGKTIQEVFAGKDTLSGQEVLIRGKVVKFNPSIMGKNWIHLQDGTGTAGTNDLTVTTKAVVKVGDTVLVKGKIALNRDFGFGYKYDILVEEAEVTKE